MATASAKAQVGAARRRESLAWNLADALEATIERRSIRWPAVEYQADPARFAREILGIELWDKQVEILEALRDHGRVAVRSGHKVGKSTTAAVAALWFFCCFPDARVLLTAPTSRQVDRVLWRELRRLHARALVPLDGAPGALAKTGMQSEDFREAWGFTASEAESVAGTSGANMLYLVDEASGVDEPIFEAIEGNRASGTVKVLLTSNPTRTEGEFFEAFDTKARFYKTFTLSSEETPNARTGQCIIPGLASRSWVEEKREEWGEDSSLYKIRVKGEHALGESGKIVSIDLIATAVERWEDAPEIGRLQIGLDPAGPGLAGDESVFAVRRGAKVLRLYVFRGLTDQDHVAHLLGIIGEHRQPREAPPLVCIDREGPVGSSVWGTLRAWVQQPAHAGEFIVSGVRSSDKALRRPDLYPRVRDELWANLRDWLVAGGALPDDAKLEKELHAPDWVPQADGRIKATPKDELRETLKRSPDRADAVALAVWVPRAYADEEEAAGSAPSRDDDWPNEAGRAIDPWGALDAWRR